MCLIILASYVRFLWNWPIWYSIYAHRANDTRREQTTTRLHINIMGIRALYLSTFVRAPVTHSIHSLFNFSYFQTCFLSTSLPYHLLHFSCSTSVRCLLFVAHHLTYIFFSDFINPVRVMYIHMYLIETCMQLWNYSFLEFQ